MSLPRPATPLHDRPAPRMPALSWSRFRRTMSLTAAWSEHAYGGWEGRFCVSASLEDQRISVTVKDTGRWRVSKPRGRGRGLSVMRGLVDSVHLEPGERGTSVTLTKRLTEAAA